MGAESVRRLEVLPERGELLDNCLGVEIGKIKGPIMGWESIIDPPSYFGGLFGYVNRPNYIRIRIPYWPVVVVLSILPLSGLIGEFLRQRNRFDGRCLHCHYNLTGNTSGVCPECGTAVAGKKASTPSSTGQFILLR